MFKWLGPTSYSVALEIQKESVNKIHNNPSHKIILGLEHPPVVTLGKQGKVGEDILIPLETLENLGFQYYQVDRGGHATLHNPGQLVIYPILNLNHLGIGVREYVELLVKSTHDFLLDMGIKTFEKKNNPGLYTEKGKIAFFGVRISRGVTSHGISINIKNNIEDFSFIKSCGAKIESFDRVGGDQSLEDLFLRFQNFFKIQH